MPQPAGRRRTRPQTRRTARRDRDRPRPDRSTASTRGTLPAPIRSASRSARHSKRYRDEKALPDRRSPTPRSPTPASTAADRGRGGTGRVLHPADQPHRDRPSDRRCRARLQGPRTGRAGVRSPQRPRARRSGRSITASRTASARTCCSACSPTTSPGICKAAWTPLLFTDEHRPVSPDPVAKAIRSTSRPAQSADQTHQRRRSPAHSYRTLLAELATLTRNTIRLHGHHAAPSRSSPSRPRCKPKRSNSPRTRPSWSFGRHDPNTPNRHETHGIHRIPLTHQGELRFSQRDHGEQVRRRRRASCLHPCGRCRYVRLPTDGGEVPLEHHAAPRRQC